MTARRPYEDGVHYVAPAPATDRHPLRWLVKSVRQADVKTSRRAESKEDGARIALHLSQQAIRKSKKDRALFEAYESGVTERVTRKAEREKSTFERREKMALEKFATTHFNCIRANPVAQVWQCVSAPGERKPVGRRKSNGKAPDQTPIRHTKGECAVMLGSEPLRDNYGSVIVFPNWQQAEQVALELYDNADEEERIVWQEPEGRVVGRTLEVEIMFDPAVNGITRPFNLWFYRHGKPFYRQPRARALITSAKDSSGRSFQPQTAEQRAAHDLNRRIERMGMDDNKMLTMEVAKYRTIWEAEAEAVRLEREYFGNGKFYP